MPPPIRALFEQAMAHHRAGRLDEAEKAYRQIMRAEPRDFPSRYMMGRLRLDQGRNDEAAKVLEAAVKIDERSVQAVASYGVALLRLSEHASALEMFDQAFALDPRARTAELLTLRGVALGGLRRFDEAIASHDAAIAIDPQMASALFNRGAALDSMGQPEAAVESYDRALAINPDYVAALNNRSAALISLRRFSEARTGLERVLALDPDHIYAFGSLAHCLMHLCDWAGRDEIVAELRTHVLTAKSEIHPGTLLNYIDDPALQLVCARNYAALNLPKTSSYDGAVYAHEKIRLAYVSADFHDHVVSRLAVELFERHDRARFEVIAISLGPDDDSPMRHRLIAAFDQFHTVRLKSDDEIVGLIRDLEINIAIDLNGYTHNARPGLLARRLAPIQVTYLGFPGTLGADCFNYLLADETVAPMTMQPHFSERIVHLAGCFQPNDSRRGAPVTAMSRQEAGLPEAGFVFCCFNANYKINPALFDVWMRLLRAVDDSVLWLRIDSENAIANLRNEATARGVDPARLVFAPRVEAEEHFARHKHADLFLDTLPYGAHTTASDALWMGVPVLTCMGHAFAGRVGASLCRAVGLEELVTADLAAYEQTALALTRDPARLNAMKAHLLANRATHRLFDAQRHCSTVEAAFVRMMERHRRGEAPAGFAANG